MSAVGDVTETANGLARAVPILDSLGGQKEQHEFLGDCLVVLAARADLTPPEFSIMLMEASMNLSPPAIIKAAEQAGITVPPSWRE